MQSWLARIGSSHCQDDAVFDPGNLRVTKPCGLLLSLKEKAKKKQRERERNETNSVSARLSAQVSSTRTSLRNKKPGHRHTHNKINPKMQSSRTLFISAERPEIPDRDPVRMSLDHCIA